jgi:hypothetical protein
MGALEIILLVILGLAGFYVIKINIVFSSLLNAGGFVTHVKIYAISASAHGRLSDEDLNYVLDKLKIESVVKNAWFCFLCPWIWGTKQCFRKGRFKKIMAFYIDIQI